jgi:hypothetical protein
MNLSRSLALVTFVLVPGSFACGPKDTSSSAATSGSEVAVSTVSGALNKNSSTGAAVGVHSSVQKKSLLDKGLDLFELEGTAHAASWSCSGANLSPSYAGPSGSPYAFTPPSCKVTWEGDISATSRWSSTFDLAYGSSCDKLSPFMQIQSAGCELVVTTAEGGNTRTITGPLGGKYEITHDTNGEGTGWDSTFSPAPTNAGVDITCGSSGCAEGGTLAINGSHISGTVDLDGVTAKVWDHTVTSSGLTLTSSGGNRVVSGSVTVQHNIIHALSTTTFNDVTYGDSSCCFPTSGSVSTSYSKGLVGKTESMEFSSTCGETTFTDTEGKSASFTLTQCL